jgi:IS605 OrfB family transposase
VPAPSAKALYLYLPRGRSRGTFFRRIGADEIGGKAHPAPWARLDRQFLIKLQGEARAPRKASLAELSAIEELEAGLGYVLKPRRSSAARVDMLMSRAVELVRGALRRHGDVARIAHAFGAAADDRQLERALKLWHGLAYSDRWRDDWAREEWEREIRSLPGYNPAVESRDAPLDLFEPLTFALARRDRMKLHFAWAQHWKSQDAAWRPRLRALRDWVVPGWNGGAGCGARQHVGGLSWTRIATVKSLYQVQKAYFARLRPDGTHASAAKGFGHSLLEMMERLRQNRVKQLSSRIVEAALGLGIERGSAEGRGARRPRSANGDLRFAPCHAVVVENLDRYRPEQIRTRRENRALMNWAAAKIGERLEEGCALHGLHLRSVQPQYTSRQDSRTGMPGLRCTDVSAAEFLGEGGYWGRRLESARRRAAEGKGDAIDRYLADLQSLAASRGPGARSEVFRVPHDGGEIFVSADPRSPAARGLQADLNAAANIGLRALLDPDWPGRWWYVPVDRRGNRPAVDKVKGSLAFEGTRPLREGEGDGGARAGGAIVNLWRDVSAEAIGAGARSGAEWKPFSQYWNGVKIRVAAVLRDRHGLPRE